LIDLEAVYCPRLSNDRLLLGLKGSLNEYELDLLRQRSVEARRAKAQRGELLVAAPVGFLKTDAPHVEKDPARGYLWLAFPAVVLAFARGYLWLACTGDRGLAPGPIGPHLRERTISRTGKALL
jgi:hypothetical protein